jgi:hypothetical protein
MQADKPLPRCTTTRIVLAGLSSAPSAVVPWARRLTIGEQLRSSSRLIKSGRVLPDELFVLLAQRFPTHWRG